MKRLLRTSLFFYALLLPIGVFAQEQVSPLLTLREVLSEAVENNAEIKAAKAAVLAAKERIPQARAFDDPELGVMQWSIPSNFALFDANETWYSLSQHIPYFGKREKRATIAALESQVMEERVHALKQRVIAQTKQAYFDLFFVYKKIEIHHEQVDLSRRFSAVALEHFKAGQAGQLDVIRAQMELLGLANDLHTLEASVSTANARLNMLLNRPVSSPLGKPETPILPLLPLSVEVLQEKAAQARPENRGAALEIKRWDEAIGLAKTEAKPDFTAELSYWDVHGGGNRWMTSVRMNLPWFNKKKIEAQVREAVSERGRTEAMYEFSQLETRFQVQNLFTRVESNSRLLKLYGQGLLPLAEQSQEAAMIGYVTRKNDFLALIEAQKKRRDMQLAYFQALVDVNKDMTELEQISGELF